MNMEIPPLGERILDAERGFFDKLSSDDKNERMVRAGGEDKAIRTYSDELAEHSLDSEKDLISEEERNSEVFKNLTVAAENVVKCFQLKYDKERGKGDNIVIITDPGVPEIVKAAFFEVAKDAVGNDLRIMVSKTPENLAQPFGEEIGEKLGTANKIILLTSKSRSHSLETKNVVIDLSSDDRIASLQKRRQKERQSMFAGKAAIFSITRANNIELLTEGAALENVEEMWTRTDRFMEKFADATEAHIVTEKGTDLVVKIKEKTIYPETGRLDQPGNIANFPFGEVCSVPISEGTSGILVVDGVGGKAGAITNDGYVKEPIKMHIENGIVVKMEGGREAEEFWKYLGEKQEEYEEKNPGKKGNAFALAEFAVGMNAAAYRMKDGEKILPPTQLEAEKALGTIHIAVGNNALLLGIGGYGPEDPDYNPINTIHSDQVICNPTIVIKTNKGEELKIMEKGELI